MNATTHRFCSANESTANGTKLKRPVIFAGLTLALILGITGMVTLKTFQNKAVQIERDSKLSRLKELDKKAQIHFEAAHQKIPSIVKFLTRPKNILKVCGYLALDKFTGSKTAQNYLAAQIYPITAECNKAAKIYGVSVESSQFARVMQEVSAGHFGSSLYSIGGLGIEAIMLKNTIASVARVCASMTARMATVTASGKLMAVADGPLPIGDIAAIAMTVGGSAMCAYDLWQCYVQLPHTLTSTLKQSIESCRDACRKVYLE